MTLSQAVSECGKWGNLMRALAKVDEVAKFVANLAQQEAELKASIVGLRTEQQAASDARDRATADAIDIRARAQQDADAVRAKASEQAIEVISTAKAEAQAANEAAAKARSDADADVERAKAARAELRSAEVHLGDVLGKIEDAKAEARRRFGG